MKKEIKEFYEYAKNNKKQILIVFILTILTYFVKLFNYNISIDSEVTTNLLTANNQGWIATGRWALVVLTKFLHLGRRYNPFFSNIVMIIFLTLAVVVVAYTIYKITKNKKLEKPMILTIGALVVTSPIIVEMLNFTMMTAEVAIGIFLVTISVLGTYLAIYKNKKISYLISCLLLAFSMGIYQGLFPIYISLIVFIYILELITNKEKTNIKTNIINGIKILAIFIISYILCTIVSKVLVNHYHLVESTYLTSQIRWGKDDLSAIIYSIKEFIKSVIMPDIHSPIYNYSYLFVTIGTIIYSIYLIIKKKFDSILPILCFIVLLVSPFLIVFLTGTGVAIRTMMNLPFIVALLMLLFIITLSNKKNSLICLYLVVGLFTIIQIKSSMDLFYSDYVRYQEDKSLVQAIFTKVDLLQDLPNGNRLEAKVVFIGMHSPIATGVVARGDTMSYSFFEWDPATEFASNKRINGLARTLGYNYIVPTAEEVKIAQSHTEDLAVYPAKDSIKVIDDLVIVRMS